MNRSALPIGAWLDEMEILRVLAIGGFGIVYLARDHSLDRDVAVKEFMPSQLAGRSQGQQVTVLSASDADIYALSLKSFVNEAKLLAQFSHPAMVKVFRFWEANGTAYMAMPYVRGPTLFDIRCSMSEPPTEAWLRSVIEPLLDALAVLHGEGCFHRDIAPDNVLVSGPGLPVLLDFGAARHLIGDRTQTLTAVLKPRYAPIEQYAESTRLRQGPWTDLYALAALVTYLLDGAPPPASTARAIYDEMALLADRDIAGVSTTFLAAIDWALAVRPQDRPQSVAELRDALNGRVAPPGPRRARRPAASSEADPATTASVTVTPFPPTQQLNRAARSGGRFARWSWAAVAASGLVAGVLAWPRERYAPPAPVSARVELAAQAPTARPVQVATTETLVARHDEPPAAIQRATTAPAALAPVAKAHRPLIKRTARERKPVGIPVISAGPLELCAGRNFFVRPYCVQRRCEEPRFKAHTQCTQIRELAQRRNE
ncbi:MAG: serine/threonine-protein kinase [Burkholderiales bacterium]